jgi:hypothetical protein
LFFPIILVCGFLIYLLDTFVIKTPDVAGGIFMLIVMYFSAFSFRLNPKRRKLDSLMKMDVSKMKLLVVTIYIFINALLMWVWSLFGDNEEFKTLAIKVLLVSAGLLVAAYIRHKKINNKV